MNNETLLQLIEQALAERKYHEQVPQGLFAPIAYTLDLGGKRVRPLLCLLALRLYADDVKLALPIAAALEVFHNFTLLHDDLMDKSPIRRGKPTVYKAWSENVAILSGDVMSIEAYRCLEGIDDAQLLKRVLSIFNYMAIEICRGQQYDMEFEERSDVRVEEYMEMIRLKTAVLLGAALRLGALAGGASEADAERLDRVGQALGLAFQIQDDYLDVYGDEATFGKPIGEDIMNGKKTLMLLYTQEQLSPERRAELKRLMKLPEASRAERIQGVTQLYTEAGTDRYAREQIARLTEEATSILHSLQLPEERLSPLLSLFDKLRQRQS